MNSEMFVLAFHDEAKAGAVLAELKALQGMGTITILDAAVLVRHADGRATLHETEDVDTTRGALFGALVGGLFGAWAGPVGALAGAAAGAITGGVAAHFIDVGLPDEFLRDVEAALPPNSSALLILVECAWSDKLAADLARFDGTLFRLALKEEIAAQLSGTLSADRSTRERTKQKN